MIDLFKKDGEKQSFVSTFNDPFKNENIERISFTIRNDFWTNHKTEYSAIIYFKKNETKGEHKINADSFIELVSKVEQLTKSL